MELGVVLVGLALPFFVLWRLSRSKPADVPEAESRPASDFDAEAHERQEQLYIAGDGDALRAGLNIADLNQFVPHATALGLYAEALAAFEQDEPEVEGLSEAGGSLSLLDVNAAELLSELGRYDEALRLLERESEFPLLEAGRRCTRAWVLTLLNRSDDAVAELENADDDPLENYKAEYWFTLAFAHLTAGRLDEAEHALKASEAVLVRASSQRNFHFLVARLRWKQGRREEALTHFETAAKHRWRWQGGSGLLAWGDVLKELGRDHEARAAWAQCSAQDPQSLAASAARDRLSAS